MLQVCAGEVLRSSLAMQGNSKHPSITFALERWPTAPYALWCGVHRVGCGSRMSIHIYPVAAVARSRKSDPSTHETLAAYLVSSAYP